MGGWRGKIVYIDGVYAVWGGVKCVGHHNRQIRFECPVGDKRVWYSRRAPHTEDASTSRVHSGYKKTMFRMP